MSHRLDKRPPMPRTMGAREWGLLLALSGVWGGSFLLIAIALRGFPPFTVVLGRVGLAAIALWLFVYLSGRRMPASWGTWGAFLILGTLNNAIPFSLIVWGQTQIDSGLAAILNATTPLFVVVLAHVLTDDERLTANRVAGIVAGIAGVAVMVGPDALRGLGAAVWAQLAILGASLSYACAGIFGRRFGDLHPAVTAAGQVTASTCLILPVAVILDRPWSLPAPSSASIAAIIAIALLSTAMAYILYFRILATAGATNLLLVTLLIPPSAVVLGFLVLGEQLSASQLAGMGLIGLGLLVIDGRPVTWTRRALSLHRP